MAIVEKTRVYEKVPVNEVIYENESSQVPTYGYGIRHVQILLVFICMIIGYIARAHLGVSIVAMTNTLAPNRTMAIVNLTVDNDTDGNETDVTDLNASDVSYEKNTTNSGTIFENKDSIWNVYQTYDWSKPIQEMILGAFFLGYCIAMFPTGMACQRFGGKLPLQMCLLINGIISFVTPSVAVWGGWKAVCCCRVLQGASQAGLYPSAHTLLANWVPISERASLASFVYTGTLLGTVMAFQIGGVLADCAAGWPATFWLTGALCVGAFVMLTVFGAASPALHNNISDDEKNYILGKIDTGSKKKANRAPWRRIFTSRHVWSAFITHTACGVCFVFLFTQIPTYMHYILGFDVKNSGLLSSLPYVVSAITIMGYGLASDFCINRGFLTTRMTRILSNSLASVGTAACLVILTYTHNRGVAVFLLSLALGMFAGVHSGWMVNYIDLSPNFSGSLMATGNTCSTIGIICLPVLTSNVVTDVSQVQSSVLQTLKTFYITQFDRHQWRIIMFIMASILFVTNTFFVLFMSADPQPWDQIDDVGETEMKPMQTKPVTEKK